MPTSAANMLSPAISLLSASDKQSNGTLSTGHPCSRCLSLALTRQSSWKLYNIVLVVRHGMRSPYGHLLMHWLTSNHQGNLRAYLGRAPHAMLTASTTRVDLGNPRS